MRTLLLTLVLGVATTPALAEDPRAETNTATTTQVAPASTAPLQGEIRFHVEGMKKSGDGF